MGLRMKVAVPSETPGGLRAARSAHVGKAETFTVVDVSADGSVGDSSVLANPTSGTSSHGVVAAMLVEHAVTDLVVRGIGEGMRAKLEPAGVRIWHDARSATVEDAVRSLVAGTLAPVEESHVHGSGHGQHGDSPARLN